MVFVETSFPRGGVAKPTAESPAAAQPDIVCVRASLVKNVLFTILSTGIWCVHF